MASAVYWPVGHVKHIAELVELENLPCGHTVQDMRGLVPGTSGVPKKPCLHAGVGYGVGYGVGNDVGYGVGYGVGNGVGYGVGYGVGTEMHASWVSAPAVQVPSGQSLHAPLAAASWNRPLVHTAHAASPLELAKRPVAQSRHEAPEVGLYLPTWQSVQRADCAGAYWPLVHSEQLGALKLSLNWPTEQDVQAPGVLFVW
jgi:hypothetical protein